MELAPALLDVGARVVDLSGAFRLRTPENYKAWYKEPHTQPALLAEAVYGLPEFCRERIPAARLVANPGCYPTAANLAIRPLVEAGVVDRAAGIVCDAKSGRQRGGPQAQPEDQLLRGHRELFGVFHSAPPARSRGACRSRAWKSASSALRRTCCQSTGESWRPSTSGPRPGSAEELLAVYEKRYAAEPFVRLYQPGDLPDLRGVARTNFCDIGVTLDRATGRAVVVSAIDNLVKGAAGQAVQNMNLMLGYDETEGLL